MQKKVLIITYYWPPSGGGGVQRWLKFAKYLPEFGWKPLVIVPENPEYPVLDASLEKDVHPEAEIYRLPIWEPYSLFKKLTKRKKTEKVNTGLLFDEKKQSFTERLSLWIRGNLLLPDPRVFWIPTAVKALKKIILETKPDAIITTGPPHSLHLIGQLIKKRFPNLYWISDFRDPWSEIDYLDKFYASKPARGLQKRMEKKVLNRADKVVTVSQSWAKDLQKHTKTPVICITNGYDEEDFSISTKKKQDEEFILSHVGIINSFRSPESLWQAIEELCDSEKEFYNKFKLQLIGTVDEGLKESLKKYRLLHSKTNIVGYIPHSEVMNVYSASSCLLLLQNNTKNSLGHIPGKFFEYMASKTPILAIGAKNSDVGRILEETNAGAICGFNNKTEIKNYLLSLSKTKTDDTLKINLEAVKQFSRYELSRKLSTEINNQLIPL